MLIDIDECASVVHDCHSSASCTNTVGSFSCSCNRAYTGDGKTCKLAAGKYVTFILCCCTMLDICHNSAIIVKRSVFCLFIFLFILNDIFQVSVA